MSHSVGRARHRCVYRLVLVLGLVLWLTADVAPADSPVDDAAAAAESTAAAPDEATTASEEDSTREPDSDAKAPVPAAKPPASSPRPAMGDPNAAAIVGLLNDEMIDGLKRRNVVPDFARFRAYSRQKLDATAGDRLTSEVTGNCRLNWYDHLLRNPLKATSEAEAFTRDLHRSLVADHEGLDRALVVAGEKLDLPVAPPADAAAVTSPQQAIDAVRRALEDAQVAYAAALAPLTGAEVGRLSKTLYTTMTRNGDNGHTLADRSSGRYMCDLLEKKVDRQHWITAARAMARLADPAVLDQLAQLPDEGEATVAGVTGRVLQRIATPAGDIVIGGREANTYELDAMTGVAAVIDLGGNDAYRDGTCSVRRPVLAVIDMAGDDRYRSKLPGVQGGAVLGVSLLVDRQGDDVYQAIDVAQGSCLGGAGILIDGAGNDAYVGVRRIQGQAIGGVGILIDRGGKDRYRGAMWSQGFAGPLGFAVLEDLTGNDHYFAGGLYVDSYEETPGYDGWGQGVGAGIRQVADGGVGVILDGGGDDVYEYDYLSHGGGYWLGLGFARDFGGNDQRLGATRENFDGSQRYEPRFQRFSNGFGCHYAAGFCFDDAGDDVYVGNIMCIGFAWDVAIGALCDFAGNDQYRGSVGNGAQAGLGILHDYAGDDVYRGGRQAMASSSISYHDMPYCGGNFSFVIDYGGMDRYDCGARNNSYIQRGASGGFLIDRPKEEEVKRAQAAAKQTQDGKPEPKSRTSSNRPRSSRSTAQSKNQTTRRR